MEYSDLFEGLSPVHMPDGTSCPDCSAQSKNDKLKHDLSCPMGIGWDEAGAWFKKHPGEDQYLRPANQ